ncbi:MAG: molybdate ABC transporter substrate-binding protein [Deltaproteobacteria bacterium]|nr:molybdate ABC transporter substrate-binding protein [Deltaproteobacteria bacterium]MCB9788430.1 molybdate ABC transporter substrate-binding protein [Deltaproteobacteria bacterium]
MSDLARGFGWLTLAVLVGCGPGREAARLRVLAAASLAPAARSMAEGFEAETGVGVDVVAGASSTLARQIEAGAPADLFLSADPRWLAWLSARGRVAPCDMADLATNRLVVLARDGDGAAWRPGTEAPGPLPARLAVGDPEHVPVGRYARESLEALGLWAAVAPRVVATADAPAAVALLARGAVPAAIAYATDARGAPGVHVVAELPPSSHRVIVYRAGLLGDAPHPSARALLAWLQTPPARARMAALGFGPPPAGADAASQALPTAPALAP